MAFPMALHVASWTVPWPWHGVTKHCNGAAMGFNAITMGSTMSFHGIAMVLLGTDCMACHENFHGIAVKIFPVALPWEVPWYGHGTTTAVLWCSHSSPNSNPILNLSPVAVPRYIILVACRSCAMSCAVARVMSSPWRFFVAGGTSTAGGSSVSVFRGGAMKAHGTAMKAHGQQRHGDAMEKCEIVSKTGKGQQPTQRTKSAPWVVSQTIGRNMAMCPDKIWSTDPPGVRELSQ